MVGSNYNRPTITNMFHAHFRSVLEVQFLDTNRFNNFRPSAQLFRVDFCPCNICCCCCKCGQGGELEGKDDTEGPAVVTTGLIKFVCCLLTLKTLN